MGNNEEIVRRVAEVYSRLEEWLGRSPDLAGECSVCGRCCDFKQFDHRLFVSTPELIYLAASPGEGNLRAMTGGRCPYQVEQKCSIYENRFAGCRIFCCKADKEFQSELSEWAVRQFKSMCEELGIGYRYRWLEDWLKEGFSIYRREGGRTAGGRGG